LGDHGFTNMGLWLPLYTIDLSTTKMERRK